MKKVLFVLFLISASVSFSQTDVSGAISSDTTWGTSGSPYTVTGNVLISSGARLFNPLEHNRKSYFNMSQKRITFTFLKI